MNSRASSRFHDPQRPIYGPQISKWKQLFADEETLKQGRTIMMADGNDAIAQDLKNLLTTGQVIDGPAARRAYDCDAYTVDRSSPAVIVLPQGVEEIAKIVRYCNANEIPFTARGAGTGLSGGSLAALGGVIISTKRMTRILNVDPENKILTAEAGATNKSLSDAVASYGLHFAPDPSSGLVSTLGGNIAENSGGPHTLKLGVTSGHILAVKMVEPGGEIWELGSNLFGSPGLNFLSLVVGGEGTLGIVAEATVKLTPTPQSVVTALIAFSSIRDATETVAAIISEGIIPAALEMMDKNILVALHAAFGLSYPESSEALLLVECDGSEMAVVKAEMDHVKTICMNHHSLNFEVAESEKERKYLWKARKQGIGAMGRLAPTIVTHDGVIPRSKLPEMLDMVYGVAKEYGLGVANLFHAGDGNLHPCFYFDDRVPGIIEKVSEAGEKLMKRCIELGGSITGEHGVGVEKIDLMPLMFGEEGLKLQASAKAIFNDGSLCNPCKILPNQKSCVEHRMRWRGAAT